MTDKPSTPQPSWLLLGPLPHVATSGPRSSHHHPPEVGHRMKPCIVCGEPSNDTRCDEHRRELGRIKTEARTRKTNGARWQAMSKRLRRISPFCELCGSTDHLQVDHVIPYSEAPELEYVRENCRILCRSCNSARGDRVTPEERAEVMARIAARKRRRVGLTDRGVGVDRDHARSSGEAQTRLNTPGRYTS